MQRIDGGEVVRLRVADPDVVGRPGRGDLGGRGEDVIGHRRAPAELLGQFRHSQVRQIGRDLVGDDLRRAERDGGVQQRPGPGAPALARYPRPVDPATAEFGVGFGERDSDQASAVDGDQHGTRPRLTQLLQLQQQFCADGAEIAGTGRRIGLFGRDQVEHRFQLAGLDGPNLTHPAIVAGRPRLGKPTFAGAAERRTSRRV